MALAAALKKDVKFSSTVFYLTNRENLMMNIKRLAQTLLAKRGLELKYKAVPCYIDVETIRHGEELIKGYTMLSHTRLVSLAEQVAYCNFQNIAGSFVECGVWKGGAVALMAHVSKKSGNANRDLHLFDAFQDICPPDPQVDGYKAIKETQKYGSFIKGEQKPMVGIYDDFGGHGTVEACQAVIIGKVAYPQKHVHFHQGWFQDTVYDAAKSIGDIALLRLDGDWYESTKTCLNALYDNVVSGGFIIFDDYLTYEGCKRAVDEFMTENQLDNFLIRADSCCYYIIKK